MAAEVRNGRPGATSVSPAKYQPVSASIWSSGVAMKPSSDIAMSAITVCGLGEEELVWLVMGSMFGPRRGGTSARWPRCGRMVAGWETPAYRTALVGRVAERAALARALGGGEARS